MTKDLIYCQFFDPYVLELTNLSIRLEDFYRFNVFDKRRRDADLGRQTFFEVWQDVAPEAYKADWVRAERIGLLCKLRLTTYAVYDIYKLFI